MIQPKFNIPEGKWKHVKKSWSWEQHNDNFAKGKTGDFRMSGAYLHWQSNDATTSLFIEVKAIRETKLTLYIIHRSGLEYWFKRIPDGKDKKETT